MTEKREYAVLRFVEQSGYCYMVHDLVQGHSIMEYAKEEVKLEKNAVSRILNSLTEQMEQFYKCEEQEAYGFVNPYALIVTEEGEVRLLDTEAEENRELLMKMRKKKVRVLFVSPEYVLSQKKRREDDLYGFGKSVQFVMDKCCARAAVSWREEKVLQKLYARCKSGGKASLAEWKSMRHLLQKLEKKEPVRPFLRAGSVVLLALAMLVTGVCLGKELFVNEKERSSEEAILDELKEELQKSEAALKETEDELRLSQQYAQMWERIGKDLMNGDETQAGTDETKEGETSVDKKEEAESKTDESEVEETEMEKETEAGSETDEPVK